MNTNEQIAREAAEAIALLPPFEGFKARAENIILAALTQQLAAAREDTERLDWLETQRERAGCRLSWSWNMGITPAAHGCDESLSYPTVRAAIDAAIKADAARRAGQ